jgi:hypothetical protein
MISSCTVFMVINMSESNPLTKFFRQPQLYIKLPSNGRWYKPDGIDMPVTKEFPVFSMSAKDELSLQTPDALLNGQSTVDVIQSCIPNIKNAWDMPAVDVDPALIAIRRASYGDAMDFVSVCPHCNTKNEQSLNLSALADRFKEIDFDDVLVIEGLEIFLKPQTYEQVNKSNMEKFEHQRLLEIVGSKTLTADQKMKEYHNLFHRILDLTVDQISLSVVAIRMEDKTLVDNRAHINEFMKKCNKNVWNSIKNRLLDINNSNPLQNIDLVCDNSECRKDYSTPLVFENSNFFG